MPMRVHEVHPALAHFPVALLPTAVAADLIGRLTDNDSLMDMGRQLMPLSACWHYRWVWQRFVRAAGGQALGTCLLVSPEPPL
jgi:uncharacterized membrane protein